MLQYLILCWLTQYNFCKYGLCNGFIPATVYIHNAKNLPFSMASLYSNFLCMDMHLLTVVVCILTSLGMPRQGRYLKRLAAKTCAGVLNCVNLERY